VRRWATTRPSGLISTAITRDPSRSSSSTKSRAPPSSMGWGVVATGGPVMLSPRRSAFRPAVAPQSRRFYAQGAWICGLLPPQANLNPARPFPLGQPVGQAADCHGLPSPPLRPAGATAVQLLQRGTELDQGASGQNPRARGSSPSATSSSQLAAARNRSALGKAWGRQSAG